MKPCAAFGKSLLPVSARKSGLPRTAKPSASRAEAGAVMLRMQTPPRGYRTEDPTPKAQSCRLVPVPPLLCPASYEKAQRVTKGRAPPAVHPPDCGRAPTAVACEATCPPSRRSRRDISRQTVRSRSCMQTSRAQGGATCAWPIGFCVARTSGRQLLPLRESERSVSGRGSEEAV